MAIVTLQINAPLHGKTYVGPSTIDFSGAVNAPAPVPLFFQWYSSLAIPPPPATPGDPLSENLAFTRTLVDPGSYVISLAARDVESSTPDDLKRVQSGGLAGGPKGTTACVIHVLVAKIIEPAPNVSLPRSSLRLSAAAPLLWGDLKPPSFGPTHDKSKAYDAIDHLQYHWLFVPVGAPAGRPSADFIPTNLLFDPADATANCPVLRYDGPAPDSVALGAYEITLRVEDKTNVLIWDEAHTDVTFTA